MVPVRADGQCQEHDNGPEDRVPLPDLDQQPQNPRRHYHHAAHADGQGHPGDHSRRQPFEEAPSLQDVLLPRSRRLFPDRAPLLVLVAGLAAPKFSATRVTHGMLRIAFGRGFVRSPGQARARVGRAGKPGGPGRSEGMESGQICPGHPAPRFDGREAPPRRPPPVALSGLPPSAGETERHLVPSRDAGELLSPCRSAQGSPGDTQRPGEA